MFPTGWWSDIGEHNSGNPDAKFFGQLGYGNPAFDNSGCTWPGRGWRTVRIHQTRSIRGRWRRALDRHQRLLYFVAVLPVL